MHVYLKSDFIDSVIDTDMTLAEFCTILLSNDYVALSLMEMRYIYKGIQNRAYKYCQLRGVNYCSFLIKL